MGKHAKAIRMARRAVELGPEKAGLHFRLGTVLLNARNHDAAVIALRKAVELDPRYTIAHIYLGIVECVRGNNEEAATELHVAERSSSYDSMPHLAVLTAYGYSRIGRRDDVERVLDKFEEMAASSPVGAGSEAFASLALGDDDNALDWLQSAIDKIENQEPDVSYYNLMLIKANAFSDPLLDELRFQELRSRLGFSE
jgi:Flp pilus assembly protein TadD